jgi:hypothetical protein
LEVASNIKNSQDTNYFKAMTQTYSTPILTKSPTQIPQFNANFPGYPQDHYEQRFSTEPLSSAGAKLKDLCPEDRAKIGELMKRLAAEKEEKEKIKRMLEEKEKDYQTTIEKFKKQNHDILYDALNLKSDFEHSLKLLKTYKV